MVLNEVKQRSFLLSRFSDSHFGLPISTAIMLTNSLIRSKISYAWPHWRPPHAVDGKYWQALQSAFVQPLRRSLGLARSCSHRAILVECGLPRLDHYFDYLALTWLSRTALSLMLLLITFCLI